MNSCNLINKKNIHKLITDYRDKKGISISMLDAINELQRTMNDSGIICGGLHYIALKITFDDIKNPTYDLPAQAIIFGTTTLTTKILTNAHISNLHANTISIASMCFYHVILNLFTELNELDQMGLLILPIIVPGLIFFLTTESAKDFNKTYNASKKLL